MPLGFQCLRDVANGEIPEGKLVDIVAVHDIYEDSVEAWTDPKSGVNWLKDFLPEYIPFARVVTYGYSVSASALFASDAADTIQKMAESLVQELRANRQFAGSLRRPIIFVCHGFGGVLVKKSLCYSSSRTAPKVVHLWDQFISTFAILFFGTPHRRTTKSNWLELEAAAASPAGRPVLAATDRHRPTRDPENPQIFQLVDTDFGPLIKQFYMFFFWEQLPTLLGHRSIYIVDSESAAPKIDNTERAGIHATHTGMVKFRSKESSDYRTVIAAMNTYSEKAPAIISHRWRQAEVAEAQLRAGEAWELGGFAFDIHLGQPFGHRDISVKSHFYLPTEATSSYVGCEDQLMTLRYAFFPGGSPITAPGRKSFVVFGMGGSGKTELCAKFASDNKHRYAAVFTIRAASTETITESFCRIGKLGGLEPTENAGRHFLSQQSEPWLLIVDNADDRSLKLRELFPAGDAAHILVTTRNRDFRDQGSLGAIELKGLKEAEALQLLLTKADIPRPWDAPTTEVGSLITKALGYLALALIQAGNCVYRGVCDLAGYLDIHASAREKVPRRAASPDNDELDGTIAKVYSTFDVSLQLLMKEPTLPRQDASDLLRVLAFYHFELIPVDIFFRAVDNRSKALQRQPVGTWSSRLITGLVQRLESPKALPGFLRGGNGKLDRFRLNWAIAELQSLSFIRYDKRHISMHPLIHSWARDSLTLSQRSIWASVALSVIMESISLPPESSTDADGDFHRDILPHLEACLAENGGPISQSTNSLGRRRLQFARYCQPTLLFIVRDQVQNAAKSGWVFAERGKFEKAAEYLFAVKEILDRLMGPEDEKTMNAMLGLAGVYWGLGRLEEAIDLQRSVVERRSRLLGPTHLQTLQSMDQLGRSYWLYGQYREALDLQEVTVERMKATLGAKHPQTLSAVDNLGVTLGAWYRYQESFEMHREVLGARKQLLGDTHLDTLATKGNLAMALMDLGELKEAKSAMTEVYEQRQKQLGKEHPWTLWALCYLAKIDIEMGLLQEAEEMLNWGIKAGVRSLSDDHLGVLIGRGQLARVYARTERLDEAEKLSLETLKKIEKARGVAHPDCVYGLYKLAQLYMLKMSPEKAIQACELALQRAAMRITTQHPLARDINELLRSIRAGSFAVESPSEASSQPSKQDFTSKSSRQHPIARAAGSSRVLTW